MCGRSCLAHVSHACRSCRRGKPESWVARKQAKERPERILTAHEREVARPRSWRDKSAQLWKNRAQTEG